MRSLKQLSDATKELRMNEHISEDSLERTIEACAWLIGIAQDSVDSHGWDPVIVLYLNGLGQTTFEAKTRQQGGMGAVAPMVTRRLREIAYSACTQAEEMV